MTGRQLDGPPPRLVAPPGACDSHIHFYDGTSAALPGTPAPPAATPGDYRRVMRRLGVARAVVVQPNAYGFDNRVTMAGVAELGPETARAVVVVDPGAPDAEFRRLHEGGARAIRVMALHGGTLGLDRLEATAARAADLGWHVIVQLDGRDLPDHEAVLARLACPVVIDHVGKFLEPVPVDHAAFRCLLRLVDTGSVWVKLSAVYETSKAGAPRYGDVGVLAATLARAAPERMLWASNWPHPQGDKFGWPDDAGLLDLLAEWMPDEAARHRTLVENPARLYGFPMA